jgi:hypothetical protein
VNALKIASESFDEIGMRSSFVRYHNFTIIRCVLFVRMNAILGQLQHSLQILTEVVL